MYTNADSLPNKIDELMGLIDIHKPDIIAITEVKPKNLKQSLTKPNLKLDSYEILPHQNCFADGGRGVCIYIHESLAGNYREITSTWSGESVWIKIINTHNKITKFGCIYRSPNADTTTNEALCQDFRSLANENIDTVIIGDFNFPEIDWLDEVCNKDETHVASRFLKASRDGFMLQHVKEPTRWRNGQRSNTLDLIFTNKDSLVSDIQIRSPIGKSDHGVVIFKVLCDTKDVSSSTTRYQYEKANIAGMKQDLSIDWEEEFKGKKMEDCWSIFKDHVESACKQHIPKVSCSTTKKRPMWMTSRCLAKIKQKHKAWRRYLETKQGREYQEFWRSRNRVKRECRNAVRQYENWLQKWQRQTLKGFGST